MTVEQVNTLFSTLLREVLDLKLEIQDLKHKEQIKYSKKPLIGIKEFSERSGIHDRNIRKMIERREIPYAKAGNKYLLDYEQVMQTILKETKS